MAGELSLRAVHAGVLPLVPCAPLRSGHLQSALHSLPPLSMQTRRRATALRAQAQSLLIECGDGVRLQAQYTAARGTARGIAVLLHGWEGSAESSCVLSLGAHLYESGYAVLRLNLRDHGDSQHLNREIFHSCRLPEVVGAVQAISLRFAGTPLFLAGFSLGGNFLLRVAAQPALPANVRGVVAISPVLDPAKSLLALERGIPIYRRTFMRRWVRSLRRKQLLWPGLHDFSALLRLKDIRAMTAELVRRHTTFPDLAAYLRGYDITDGRLVSLCVPASLLLAEDDPIVPAADLVRLTPNERLQIWRSRFGGHCGFFSGWSLPSAADRFVIERFAAMAAQH